MIGHNSVIPRHLGHSSSLFRISPIEKCWIPGKIPGCLITRSCAPLTRTEIKPVSISTFVFVISETFFRKKGVCQKLLSPTSPWFCCHHWVKEYHLNCSLKIYSTAPSAHPRSVQSRVEKNLPLLLPQCIFLYFPSFHYLTRPSHQWWPWQAWLHRGLLSIISPVRHCFSIQAVGIAVELAPRSMGCRVKGRQQMVQLPCPLNDFLSSLSQ